MICSRCGAEAPDNVPFCCYCGSNLGGNLEGNASAFNDVASPEVDDFLVWNILATFFCFQPLGLVGLIFSILSRYAIEKKDWEAAQNHAANAKLFFIFSAAIGAFFVVVGIFVFLIIAVFGALSI